MKRFIFLINCLVLAQPVLAQTVPAEIRDPEERELLVLARRLNRISLAYQTTAGQMMLKEVNYFCERLALPTSYPIQFSNASIRVSRPFYSRIESTNTSLSKAERIRTAAFAAFGTIEGPDFSFYFDGAGKLWSVHRMKIKGKDSILDLYPELAKSVSLIDTNGAYQMATQWLSAISVNVLALEQKYKPSVRQWFFWGNTKDLPKDQWAMPAVTSTNKNMLPIFDVDWGQSQAPAVKITILGTSRELLDLQMQDSSFSRRASLIITNGMALNDTPDPPIKHLKLIAQAPATNSVGTSPSARTNRPPPFHRQVGNQ